MSIHYGHHYWCLGSSVRMIRCPDTEEAVQGRDDPDGVGRDWVEANEDTEDESEADTENESDDTESNTGIKK